MSNDELTDQKPAPTPAAKWREAGATDPHGDRYNCERAALGMGHLTDDELANGVFLHGNEPLNIQDALAGKPTSIVWLDAAKDRIRWLSRQLEALRPSAVAPYDGSVPAAQEVSGA